MNDKLTGFERKCPVCGKAFIPAAQHVYKDITGYPICTWSCLVKYRKDREKEYKENREKGKFVYYINGEYLTRKQIAEKAGVSVHTIITRIRRGIRGEALLAPKGRK